VKNLLANVYGTLGFEEKEDDTQLTLLHRVIVVTWACRLGLEDCVKNATDIFSEYEEEAENNTYVYHDYLLLLLLLPIALWPFQIGLGFLYN
jgi:hypothetical protein